MAAKNPEGALAPAPEWPTRFRRSWFPSEPEAADREVDPYHRDSLRMTGGFRYRRLMATKKPKTGMRKGLTAYGDEGFSLFLRKAFIKAMGYSDDALNRPIVGITNTYSDYNPCHGNVPQIIEA